MNQYSELDTSALMELTSALSRFLLSFPLLHFLGQNAQYQSTIKSLAPYGKDVM